MLYYFNFVQGEYFKEAEASAKADAMKKLAPRALWWFRWGAMFTFLTGLVLLHRIGADMDIARPAGDLGRRPGRYPDVPQRVADHLAQAAGRAGYEAGRWPVVSAPRPAWHHAPIPCCPALCCSACWVPSTSSLTDAGGTGFYACVAIILLLEANALFGKTGPMTSVKGVIHCSIALTAVMWALLAFL